MQMVHGPMPPSPTQEAAGVMRQRRLASQFVEGTCGAGIGIPTRAMVGSGHFDLRIIMDAMRRMREESHVAGRLVQRLCMWLCHRSR